MAGNTQVPSSQEPPQPPEPRVRQYQMQATPDPKPRNVPAGRVEQVGGATRVTISTDGQDINTREPEKAPRPQESNVIYRINTHDGVVTRESTDEKSTRNTPSYPANVAVTPAGAIVQNVSGLKSLDVVTINGHTDTVLSHEMRGNLVRGEDGALRLKGTSSVVQPPPQQQQQQTGIDPRSQSDPSVPLPPNVEADLLGIGKALGAGATLGMLQGIADGSDVSVQINALARSFGIEPAQMTEKVNKVAWNLVQQAIVMSNSSPEEYDAFYAWVVKNRPAEVRAARAEAVEWGRFGATTRLVEEFRQQGAAAFTEPELLTLDGQLVNGEAVRVWKNGDRLMFSSPATGTLDMRTAIRSGIVKLSPQGGR